MNSINTDTVINYVKDEGKEKHKKAGAIVAPLGG